LVVALVKKKSFIFVRKKKQQHSEKLSSVEINETLVIILSMEKKTLDLWFNRRAHRFQVVFVYRKMARNPVKTKLGETEKTSDSNAASATSRKKKKEIEG